MKQYTLVIALVSCGLIGALVFLLQAPRKSRSETPPGATPGEERKTTPPTTDAAAKTAENKAPPGTSGDKTWANNKGTGDSKPPTGNAAPLETLLNKAPTANTSTRSSKPITTASDERDEILRKKLNAITVEHMEFAEIPVFNVVQYLRHQAKMLDPEKKGVKIRYLGSVNPRKQANLTSIELNNVPLLEAIDALCKGNNFSYELKDGKVVINGRSQAGADSEKPPAFVVEDEEFD